MATTSELFLDSLVAKELYITDGTLEIVNNEVVITGDTTTLTNHQIVMESLNIHEALCSSDDLTFGECNASEIKFSTVNTNFALKDKVMNVYFVMDNEGELEAYQMGVYTVESDVPTADRTHRDITAYDSLHYLANKDVTSWYNTLLPNENSTTTVKAMRSSLLTYCGIPEVVRNDLVNDNMQVKKTITPTQLSGLQVIQALCEVNGCFGHIDRQGRFTSVTLAQGIEGLYPALDLYPDPSLYPQGDNTKPIGNSVYFAPCKYEDYLVSEITQIEIRNEDNTIGQTVGTSGNAYIVSGNFLLFGKTSSQLTTIGNNLLGQIRGLIYRPFEVTALGNPTLLVGDAIRLNTSTQIIESYVLERKLRGIQSLRDDYDCRGNEKRDSKVNSLSTQITQLNGVVTTIKTDVDGIETDVSTLDQRESTHFSQTQSAIALKVSKDDIINEINLSTEEARIHWEKIKIEGYTTINNGFHVDLSGSVIMQGAKLTNTYVNGNDKVVLTLDGISMSIERFLNGHSQADAWTIIDNQGVDCYGDYEAEYSGNRINYADKFVVEGNSATWLGNAILTTASTISGSNVSGKVSSSSWADYSGQANDLASSARIPFTQITGTVTADAVKDHSVSSRDGLTASNNYEVVNDLIYIGGSWRAVSKTYADANYESKSSDQRIKESISDIDEKYLNALDKIKVKNFRFKNENRKFDKLEHIGVMAQEVLEVLDDCGIDITDQNIVEYREPYSDEQDLVDDGKVYCVNYNQLTTLLIPAYQKLKHENMVLRNDLDNLKLMLKAKGVI